MSLLCFNGYAAGRRSLSKKVQAWKIAEPLVRCIWTADSTANTLVRHYKYLIVGPNGQKCVHKVICYSKWNCGAVEPWGLPNLILIGYWGFFCWMHSYWCMKLNTPSSAQVKNEYSCTYFHSTPCTLTVCSLKKGAGYTMSLGRRVSGADKRPYPMICGKLQAYCTLEWLLLPSKFLDLPVRLACTPVLNSWTPVFAFLDLGAHDWTGSEILSQLA